MDNRNVSGMNAEFKKLLKDAKQLNERIIRAIETENPFPLDSKMRLKELHRVLSKATGHIEYEVSKPYEKHSELLAILGHIYFNLKEFEHAEDFYFMAIEKNLQVDEITDDNKRFIAGLYVDLCDCYFELGDHQKAKDMIYKAILYHNKIVEKQKTEEKISSSNNNSNEFLDAFRKWYQNKFAPKTYYYSPNHQIHNAFLKKSYDENDLILSSLNNIAISPGEKKERSDHDYLKAAFEYQEIIKEFCQASFDKKITDNLIGSFLEAIKAIDSITLINDFTEQDKQSAKKCFIELNTELGNLYYRLGQEDLARKYWMKVIRQTNTLTLDFFHGSALRLPAKMFTLSELLDKANKVVMKANDCVSRNKLASLYHEYIQIYFLLMNLHQYQDMRIYNQLFNIGVYFFNENQYEEAAKMFIETINNKVESSKELNDKDKRFLIETYVNLFDCFVRLKNNQAMSQAYEKAIAIFKSIVEKTWEEKILFLPPYTLADSNGNQTVGNNKLYVNFLNVREIEILNPAQPRCLRIDALDIASLTTQNTANQFVEAVAEKSLEKLQQLMPAILLTLYTHNCIQLTNEVNPVAFIYHFEADIAYDYFISSAFFKNSLDALQKIHNGFEMEALINQLAKFTIEKKTSDAKQSQSWRPTLFAHHSPHIQNLTDNQALVNIRKP